MHEHPRPVDRRGPAAPGRGAKVPDRYFVQRLYVGVEPEEQTSRELKDRYGVFAYAVNMAQRGPAKEVPYRAEVDGEPSEFQASRVYVVNSGMMGTGLRITHGYAVDDGLLDAFAIDGHAHDTYPAAASRFLDLHGERVPVPAPGRPSASRPRRTSRSGRTASTSGGRRSASRSPSGAVRCRPLTGRRVSGCSRVRKIFF